jgi:hypothetical protein
VLEIRISPETPTEFKAVLQLVQTLAVTKPGPGQADPGAKMSPAPAAEPAAPPREGPTEPEEIITIDLAWSPSGKPDPGYSAQQVLEALQKYARANGAAALREVLERFGARRVSDIKPEDSAEVMTIARGELA